MTSKEELTIEQLEYYRNTYERYDGIESNIFEQICNELINFKKNKTYTLEQCIKEWNETFKCKIGDNYDSFQIIDRDFTVSIDKKLLDFTIYGDDDCPAYISYEKYNLLSKTLKALEMENEKENKKLY